MRSVVTGASGFAGRALTAHLTAAGDDVRGWSRTTGSPDITDRAAVISTLVSDQPDIVYHLAAQSHVPTSWDDPVLTLRVNVEGTQNILDAAAEISDVRVIVITSSEIYGTVPADELPISERTPVVPTNPYATSKAAADSLAVSAHLGKGLDVVRLRPFNHIGPGQSTDFVASGFAQRIVSAVADGRRSIPVGQLDARRDFCDVRDIVRAYRCAALSGEPGAAYNVCSGVDRSIHDVAEALIAASGVDLELAESADLLRPTTTAVSVGTAASLTEATGWAPEIPFTQSIDDIYQDAVNRARSRQEMP